MRSGTFQKRKPFICAGTAELVWRASLYFPYHEKLEEIQCIMALIWSRWGSGLSCVNCWPYQFYISRVFHHSTNVINWTIIILQYAHTSLTLKTTSWRSHLAHCGEAVNNSMKGFHPMTSKEYFHEIFSRFRIINPMPVLSPSNIMLWSHTGFLSVQKSLPQLCF